VFVVSSRARRRRRRRPSSSVVVVAVVVVAVRVVVAGFLSGAWLVSGWWPVVASSSPLPLPSPSPYIYIGLQGNFLAIGLRSHEFNVPFRRGK
jgi:hypothetical protein